jgi:hypothetical protein
MLNSLLHQDRYTDKVNYLHHAVVLVKIYSFGNLHWSISEIFTKNEVKINVLRDFTPSKLVDRYNF